MASRRVDSLEQVVARRLSRREALVGGVAFGVLAACRKPQLASMTGSLPPPAPSSFTAVAPGVDPELHVPEGYTAEIVVAWGDPVLAGAAPFVPGSKDAALARGSFGANADFIGVLQIGPDRILMGVNHEYTDAHLMFAGRTTQGSEDPAEVAVEIASHGHSVIEIVRVKGRWTLFPESRFNRRIDATTPVRLAGPVAGHPRVQTKDDPEGKTVRGTLANCSGGVTPWGTFLIGEENFQEYFRNGPGEGSERRNHERYRLVPETTAYHWNTVDPRFDVSKEPKEPNRFGWMVEIDPEEPDAMPIKRTALGRCYHEAASFHVTPGGRLVVYMADDSRDEHLFRFVSAKPYVVGSTDGSILDEGTLSVARFEDDGRLLWLPLVQGEGPLTEAEGFTSQADVLVETRRAADLVGGTPLDRPEDVEVSPVTGRVYVMMTNNRKRSEVGPASPRAPNPHGHVVEILPSTEDPAGAEARWELLYLAGPASDGGTEPDDAQVFSGPDNATFDREGRLFIATDGSYVIDRAEGLYEMGLEGAERGRAKRIVRAPQGGEVCGPVLADDDRVLFFSIQHPGDDEGSDFTSPSTRWPDFGEGPPRAAVVAVRRLDGKAIGGEP